MERWLTQGVVAMVVGHVLAAWQPLVLLTVPLVLVIVLRRSSAVYPAAWLFGCLAGVAWFGFHAQGYLDLKSRISGTFDVTASVVDLARVDTTTRLKVRINDSTSDIDGSLASVVWMEPAFTPQAGQTVRASILLRPARGLANPGQFDYERWAFAEAIHGTGYVVSLALIGDDPGWRDWLDRRRDRVSQRLKALSDGPAQRLLPALAVGDRRQMTDADFLILGATGTGHLVAISGLHIGLAALFGGVAGAIIWWLVPAPSLTRRGLMFVCGALTAIAYAALSGFSVSTERALVMYLMLALAWWGRWRIGRSQALSFAAFAVLVIQPLGVASTGLYLSFGAVFALMIAFGGRSANSWWLGLLRAQLAIAVVMAPISMWLGVAPSGGSALINLIAIPWVSFTVVLPLLLGLAIDSLGLGTWLLEIAAWSINLAYWMLEWVARWELASVSMATLGLSLMAATALMLPRALGLMPLGLLAILGSAIPTESKVPADSIDLHVLDVGQGLALVLETRDRRMLYDAGPRSRSGWSAGEAIVLPFLDHRPLDTVIISHGDSDHAGGWAAIEDTEISVGTLLAGNGVPASAQPCLAGQQWQWGPARFRVLHPTPGLPDLGNDSSCVVLISVGDQHLLLPGDISANVEARLLDQLPPLTAVVAAHHGSNSSTSNQFVIATRPAMAIFSAGHGNRFNMPRPEVVSRLGEAEMFNTASDGYLHFRMSATGIVLIKSERSERVGLWHRTF